MDVLMIRHGQSEADILNVIEGRADFALTDEGRQQARLMAAWVKARFAVTHIYASPLQRAAQTAQCLSDSFGMPISFNEDLMEWQNGLLAGMNREEVARKYPKPSAMHPHTAVYGCESMIQFRARAEHALSRMVNENDDSAVIAVVSHGGMINMLFRSFMGLPVKDDIWIASGDTAVHHLRIQDGRRSVIFANAQYHLQ